jgi:hypothetical protein
MICLYVSLDAAATFDEGTADEDGPKGNVGNSHVYHRGTVDKDLFTSHLMNSSYSRLQLNSGAS